MILVTGASGKVGSELLRELAGRGATHTNVRAMFHSPEKARSAPAGVEGVTGDYNDSESLDFALRGASTLFLLVPPAPQMAAWEVRLVERAVAAGVRRIVKLSAMHAGERDYLIGHVHRRTEMAIEASGAAWTHLRPASFMQNFETYWLDMVRQGTIVGAYGTGPYSLIDTRDVAAVAAKVLTEQGHEGRAYELSGPEPLTHDDIARKFAAALGRPVRYLDVDLEVLRAGMKNMGLPDVMADVLTDLQRHIREGHAADVTGDVEALLGRKPRTFDEYLRDNLEKFR